MYLAKISQELDWLVPHGICPRETIVFNCRPGQISPVTDTLFELSYKGYNIQLFENPHIWNDWKTKISNEQDLVIFIINGFADRFALARLCNHLNLTVKVPSLIFFEGDAAPAPIHDYPHGHNQTIFSDKSFILDIDDADSWELVDEEGNHLGRRVSIRDRVSGGVHKEFWIDKTKNIKYVWADLERKWFED